MNKLLNILIILLLNYIKLNTCVKAPNIFKSLCFDRITLTRCIGFINDKYYENQKSNSIDGCFKDSSCDAVIVIEKYNETKSDTAPVFWHLYLKDDEGRSDVSITPHIKNKVTDPDHPPVQKLDLSFSINEEDGMCQIKRWRMFEILKLQNEFYHPDVIILNETNKGNYYQRIKSDDSEYLRCKFESSMIINKKTKTTSELKNTIQIQLNRTIYLQYILEVNSKEGKTTKKSNQKIRLRRGPWPELYLIDDEMNEKELIEKERRQIYGEIRTKPPEENSCKSLHVNLTLLLFILLTQFGHELTFFFSSSN